MVLFLFKDFYAQVSHVDEEFQRVEQPALMSRVSVAGQSQLRSS